MELEILKEREIELVKEGNITSLSIGNYTYSNNQFQSYLAVATSSGKIYLIKEDEIYTILTQNSRPITCLTTGYFSKGKKLQDLACSDNQGEVIIYSNLEIIAKHQSNENILSLYFDNDNYGSSTCLLTGSILGKFSSYSQNSRLWRQPIFDQRNILDEYKQENTIIKENSNQIQQIYQISLKNEFGLIINYHCIINNTNVVYFYCKNVFIFEIKFAKSITWVCTSYFGVINETRSEPISLFASSLGDIYYLDSYRKPQLYMKTKLDIVKIVAYRPHLLNYNQASLLIIQSQSQSLNFYYEKQCIHSIDFNTRIIDCVVGNLLSYQSSKNIQLELLQYKFNNENENENGLKRKNINEDNLEEIRYDKSEGPNVVIALDNGIIHTLFCSIKKVTV
ncbi:hypothetical protein K502DRAFT_367626 [Neoconidiobolus thromboides FSU 785]|nr:hypothetical protein K502DRAFT_367626 [Neoconidiobolus thromboides FSU 785]